MSLGTVTKFMGGRECEERTSILVLGGMHSAACVGRVEQALRAVPGVETAGVNLLTRLATVRHSNTVDSHDLLAAVDALGYHASLASPTPGVRSGVTLGESIDVIASRKSRFVAGALLTLLILLVDQGWSSTNLYKLAILFSLATPVQIIVGWDYYRGFFRALRNCTFTMDSLVVLGSTAAYVQGFLCFFAEVSSDHEFMTNPQFHTAAIILTVVSLGKWLEARARESTSLLWGNLDELAPKEACVVRDGREQIVPAGVVAIGDIVIVRPGDKIPVDGEIVDGQTEVNEAPITGEAKPVTKVKGDRVIVASVNGSGFIRIRAIGVGANTTLAQIARMVTDAQDRKARIEQMADKVCSVLVPLTVAIAMFAFVGWYFGPVTVKGLYNRGLLPHWFQEYRFGGWLSFLFRESSLSLALRPAIAVLVVACPCALGLATPTAVLVATGLGARRGLLFKGGEAIEAAACITDVVFDKTGVLTDGSFKAQEVLTAPGVERDELLTIAGSLEACSEHALARGVIREVKKGSLQLRKVERFEALPGRGLRGTVQHKSYLLGSRALISERGFDLAGPLAQRADAAESGGATLIFLAEEGLPSAPSPTREKRSEEGGKLLGAIALTDRVKSSAHEAIAQLHEQGIATHLLSGDNAAAALAVGKRSGLAEVSIHPLMTPQDKVEFTRKLKEQGRYVAIVVDGVSGAPALAAADVGFALGTGVDISVESGQIVLVSPDVRGVGRSIKLARAASRTIRWNLIWVFAFHIIMIPMAFFNRLEPTLAVSFMAFSSVLVVLNSLRLIYKNTDTPPPPPPPLKQAIESGAESGLLPSPAKV